MEKQSQTSLETQLKHGDLLGMISLLAGAGMMSSDLLLWAPTGKPDDRNMVLLS